MTEISLCKIELEYMSKIFCSSLDCIGIQLSTTECLTL